MKYRRIRFGQLGKNQTVDFAVQELCRCVKLMDSEIMTEVLCADTIQPAFPNVIWVGLDESLADKVPAVEDAELDDAIVISVKDGNGYITGSNYRSVLLGAFRFLRELGCDWVRPSKGGERIPQRVLDTYEVTVCEKAAYRHRGVCIEGANAYENVLDMIDYLPRVGMNEYYIQFMVPVAFFDRWYGAVRNPYQEKYQITREEVAAYTISFEAEMAKRGLRLQKTGHGWTCEPFGIDGTGWGMIDTSNIGEDVLKYMALVDGKRQIWKDKPLYTNLCYSNPEVRSIVCDAVVEYCKENRHVDVLHLWLGDERNNQCECEECVKMRPADWYVMMLNEVDEKLTAAGLDTKIVFLIYYDLLWTPEYNKIKNQDRFILMFAPITRMYGQNYSDFLTFDGQLAPYVRNKLEIPEPLDENLAYLRSWQELFKGDSFVYDYHLTWAHVADPGYEFCARNMFQDMKDLEKIGINGMISCQVHRCAFPTNLPMYMMAKALWDNKSEYTPNMEQFYLNTFGADGMEAHKYLETISRLIPIYESVASGHPVFNRKPLCDDYDGVYNAIQAVLPFIEKNANGPEGKEWQVLKIHTEYVTNYAKSLEAMEQQDEEALKKYGAQVRDIINLNEPFLQKHMDGRNTHRIFSLRTGLEKILPFVNGTAPKEDCTV